MGSVILIVPIFAFSIWLLATTGRRVIKASMQKGRWTAPVVAVVIGLVLGYLFSFHASYKMGATLRLHSFPVPSLFTYQQDSTWVDSPLPDAMRIVVYIVDFLFGTALAFFPFKIAEFFNQVKTEL